MAEQHGGRDLRAVLARAGFEAVAAGSRDIRAEHLLLAMLEESSAEPDGGRVRVALAGSGLDYGRLTEALRTERAHSLAAAGFSVLADERLTATRLPSTPSLDSSAREALSVGHRTMTRDRMSAQREAHRRRTPRGGEPGAPSRAHGRPGSGEFALAIGVLSAELGTVARALALAGLDRQALLEAVRHAAGEA